MWQATLLQRGITSVHDSEAFIYHAGTQSLKRMYMQAPRARSKLSRLVGIESEYLLITSKLMVEPADGSGDIQPNAAYAETYRSTL